MSVIHLTKESFEKVVSQAGQKVLLDFRADWCVPCQMLTPVLEELSNDCPWLTVATINVDDMPEAAAQFRVNSIPALFLVQDGKVLKQSVGLRSKEELKGIFGL